MFRAYLEKPRKLETDGKSLRNTIRNIQSARNNNDEHMHKTYDLLCFHTFSHHFAILIRNPASPCGKEATAVAESTLDLLLNFKS